MNKKHSYFLFLISLLFLALPSRPVQAGHPSPADWRDQVIYQVITDRFFDGEPSNNTANPDGTYNPSGGFDIHGGDFAGLQAKLGYIKSLGATAIWISPVFRNDRGSYHGYGAVDFYNVDPHWGTWSDLADFVAAAHAEGLYVIIDIVTNHGGNYVGSYDSGYSSYRTPPSTYNLTYWNSSRRYAWPFDDLSLFHAHGNIGNWWGDEQILGELFGLDDFKTELPQVQSAMIDVYKNLIDRTDCDGFRVDTVKHVDIGFWQSFCPAVRSYADSIGKDNFFMFAEVYSGMDGDVGYFTGTKAGGAYAHDSALYFPMFYTTNDVFIYNQGTNGISTRYSYLSYYDSTSQDRLVTFLDNHDFPRFLSGGLANDDWSRLKVALTFHLTAMGIPEIYYGTEQGFNGGNDPADREDMFDGQWEWGPSEGDNFNQTHELFQHTQKLNMLRAAYSALRRGDQTALADSGGTGIYAFRRVYNSEEAIIVFNTDGGSQTAWNLASILPAGTTLIDVLADSGDTQTLDGSGRFTVTLNGRESRVYIDQNGVKTLPPRVIASTPDHDADGHSVYTGVGLTFDRSMNIFSVENAVSIDPPISGSFDWLANTMTFTPDTNWEPGITYEFSVSAEAYDLTVPVPLNLMPFAVLFTTGSGPAPPPPDPVGPVGKTNITVEVDGSAAEWSGLSGARATLRIDTNTNEIIWKDDINDDTGDGDYSYPTESVFTGSDADIDEVRIAWGNDYIYFLIKPLSVNPGASFFTPYLGVAVDTDQVPGSGGEYLGGATDARVSTHLNYEIDIRLPGLNPLEVRDAYGNDISAGAFSAFNQATGVVEIAVPIATIGIPDGNTWDFVFYAALETFSSTREVYSSNSSWNCGGGYDTDGDGDDPDIFDLAGSSVADQLYDLSNYSSGISTVIYRSAIVVQFAEQVPVNDWRLY